MTLIARWRSIQPQYFAINSFFDPSYSMANPLPATLYIISAPSGAGKTSLVRKLLATTRDLALSISHTSRRMRPGERDGIDYHFVDRERFLSMVAECAFVEHAEVFDNLYGTAHNSLREQLASGRDLLLEIDWQGAAQVRCLFPEAVGIFILPPSRAALESRLRNRGQDDETIIARRMRDAVAEMQHYAEYDYLLINDDFDTTLEALRAIILARRQRIDRQTMCQQSLISALLAAE
jgi:guanylate kinase